MRRWFSLAALFASAFAGTLAAAEENAPWVMAQAGANEPSADVDDEYEEEGTDIAPPAGVEIFRVKGRGVSAIETDVPTSVTQFDAAAIEALGAQNVSDLAKVTPNVEIRTAGATTPTFFVRGVGLADFNANAAGAVAIYQDNVAINAPAAQLGLLFDIVGVDLQRGPQGTGGARNASAGVIRLNSRPPTGQLNANFKASYGNYNYQDYQGALELPLVEDWGLSMRGAFRYSGRDGFHRNGCAGAPSFEERFGGSVIGVDRAGTPVRTVNYSPNYSLLVDTNGDRIPDNPQVLVQDTNAGWFQLGGPSTLSGIPNPAGGPAFLSFDLGNPTTGKHCGENLNNVGIEIVDPNFPGGRLPSGALTTKRVLARISRVPAGLDSEFGNRNRWAVRNLIRWEPEDLDMDWLFKGYFTRLDEDTVLPQAAGASACTTNPGGCLGFQGAQSYTEPDAAIVRQRALLKYPNDPLARARYVSSRLARNLDPKPRRGDYNRPGPTTLDTYGGGVSGHVLVDGMTLRLVSSYDGYERTRVTDTDGTPNVIFESDTDDEAWQYYGQLSLEGESEDEPFKWEFGGYYLMEELDNDTRQFSEGFNDEFPVSRVYDQDTWSLGAWAKMEWEFLDDFTLESGIRYNWERKKFRQQLNNEASNPPTILPLEGDTVSWEAPTGTVGLRYRFTEDVSAYWKYTRGWKPGHFNASASAARPVTAARPESIDSWEAGLRGRWFEGRYSLGLAGFYYRYKDYQVFIINSDLNALPEILVVNADDAQIYGLELDFRAEPLDGYVPPEVDGLVITGRFGWLESQFLDFPVESFVPVIDPASGGTVVEFERVINQYSGNRLINSPEFTFSLTAEWAFDFARWGQIVPVYDFIWSDEVYFAQTEGKGVVDPNLNPPASGLPKFSIGQKATALHNVRLSYRAPGGNMEISGWVRNLTDETTRRQGFDASVFADLVISFVGEPRTYGMDVSFEW